MFSYKIIYKKDLQCTFPNFETAFVNVFSVNGTEL